MSSKNNFKHTILKWTVSISLPLLKYFDFEQFERVGFFFIQTLFKKNLSIHRCCHQEWLTTATKKPTGDKTWLAELIHGY